MNDFTEIKEVDWEKININSPVLYKLLECGGWIKGHFAGINNGYKSVYLNGKTSFTMDGEGDIFIIKDDNIKAVYTKYTFSIW